MPPSSPSAYARHRYPPLAPIPLALPGPCAVCAGADESGDRSNYPIWSGGASSNLSQASCTVAVLGRGMPSEIATSIASSPVIC